MKGINGNPALDAYERVAVSTVGAPRAPARAATEAGPSPQATTAAARVTISSAARELALSSTESDVNVEKVEAVRAKLESGSLQWDPQTIASRMYEALG